MKIVLDILEERISAAMVSAADCDDCSAIVRPSTDPKFGDYQANGVMGLAKKLKTNPRKLAEAVVKNLDLSDICGPPEVAGPGFINLRLKPEYLADRLLEINRHIADLAIDKTTEPKTIVVDFSCPNIAKQMHVGHLRSTIIGDCICRILECLGHDVKRQNHVGDWGTPMGMVAYSLYNHDFKLVPKEEFAQFEWGKNLGTPTLDVWEEICNDHPDVSLNDFVDVDLTTLERHYKQIVGLEQEDPTVAAEVRDFTVKLQERKSNFINKLWEEACKTTLSECYDLYRLLNVILYDKDTQGESYYKDMLQIVVNDLLKEKIAEESDGAVCVFPEGFKNKEGEPLPFIIQKSDGAYLYATTDLAALRYRVNELKADTIIYVTDSRQKLHFEMLFAVAKMAGWVGDDVELSHVMFGTVLGEDGTPLKTRSGENVKLKELLDEAVERAKSVVEEKNPELSSEKKEQIAKAVGIGAVKYADYSNNRTSDYVFSFDKMLAMDGNTAPYMQYAYARIKSIERKAQTKDVDIEDELADLDALSLTEPAELDLAKYLIRYGEALQATVADYRPNYLTAYLYELAQKFSAFYTNCPVLKAEAEKRPTRLLLCDLTAKTIRHGLGELLGIEVVEQM
ncbi:MAG: arginine--tRNA ligase [Planctomycetota bacterium]|jgi:arginyl-tRNA synthetase